MEYGRSVFEDRTDGGTIKFNDVHNWNASSFQEGDNYYYYCYFYYYKYNQDINCAFLLPTKIKIKSKSGLERELGKSIWFERVPVKCISHRQPSTKL